MRRVRPFRGVIFESRTYGPTFLAAVPFSWTPLPRSPLPRCPRPRRRPRPCSRAEKRTPNVWRSAGDPCCKRNRSSSGTPFAPTSAASRCSGFWTTASVAALWTRWARAPSTPATPLSRRATAARGSTRWGRASSRRTRRSRAKPCCASTTRRAVSASWLWCTTCRAPPPLSPRPPEVCGRWTGRLFAARYFTPPWRNACATNPCCAAWNSWRRWVGTRGRRSPMPWALRPLGTARSWWGSTSRPTACSSWSLANSGYA